MRAHLQIIRPGTTAVPVVPWWRARGVVITAKVLWWLLTYVFWVAVGVVAVALAIIGAVLFALGVMAHFAGESR